MHVFKKSLASQRMREFVPPKRELILRRRAQVSYAQISRVQGTSLQRDVVAVLVVCVAPLRGALATQRQLSAAATERLERPAAYHTLRRDVLRDVPPVLDGPPKLRSIGGEDHNEELGTRFLLRWGTGLHTLQGASDESLSCIIQQPLTYCTNRRVGSLSRGPLGSLSVSGERGWRLLEKSEYAAAVGDIGCPITRTDACAMSRIELSELRVSWVRARTYQPDRGCPPVC